MLRRNRIFHGTSGFLKTLSKQQVTDRHSIGVKRFQPTETPPLLGGRRLFQKTLKQDFVITSECYVGSRKRIARKAFKHTSRIRSAINVITQRNRKTVAIAMLVNVSANLIDETIKKIRATVNITDDIQP